MDRFRFAERSTGTLVGDIVDANGTAVDVSILTLALLTLYDAETADLNACPEEGVINSRSDQNIKNANNVTIDSSGHFIWTVQPDDNIIVTARRQIERHRAMFRFAWSSGEFRYECEIEVINLRMAQ